MENVMEQNELSGIAKNLGGKAQEGVGRATGDANMQARGRMRQAEGSMQDLYGQAQEMASQGAGSIEDSLRNYIENKPYTTAAIALAVGWVIGRAHRPF
jgi:uncharacterized protein YjbJ (UPF0337 family)